MLRSTTTRQLSSEKFSFGVKIGQTIPQSTFVGTILVPYSIMEIVPISASASTDRRIWLLGVVVPGRWGRWITGFMLLVMLVGFYWFIGVLTHPQIEFSAKSASLFFCVMIAYITPTYHYIIERTKIAFDLIAPQLKRVEEDLPDTLPRLRASIDHKSTRWHSIVIGGAALVWFLQSWVLAGSFSAMLRSFTSSLLECSMVIGPLFVWLFTGTAIASLVRNARLFSQLAQIVPIDLLNTVPLMAFGRMAVSATLVMIGSLAALSLMWLGGTNSPWAALPGSILAGGAMLYLLLVPIAPLRLRISAGKTAALQDVQQAIDAATPSDFNGVTTNNLNRLNPLLVLRAELQRVSEWPFDMHVLARFGLYLVIVPMTWVGAALIENLVDLLIE